MRCPQCGSKISFAQAKDKFACPNCKASLRYSSGKFLFAAGILGGLPWLLLEALFFHFESTVVSLVVFVLSIVIVAAVAAQLIKPELDTSG